MNQNSVKTIGINDEPRKDSILVYVNQADGLKVILNRDFEDWSNFDSWQSISAQQWIFSRAMEIYRGMKIDIKCDCCDILILLKMILRTFTKKNALVKKVLT